MPNIPVLSFNTGLLSPQIDARSDVEKYRSGCRILENMIPRIYGPATRRPGTEFITMFRYHNTVGRVIPFIYSNTIAYVVLLEPYEMRFFYDGAVLLGDDGREVIVVTPYSEADLFSLDTKQSNDVMWIIHATHAPRKLSRTAANAFSLDAITFTNGPFKTRNDLDLDDDVTMTPNAVTGTGITLTASSATFDATHVGALFKLTQARAITDQSGSLASPNTGYIGSEGATGILVEGAFVFSTEGIWTGTVVLQRSPDAGSTWETYRTWVANDARNIQYTGDELEDNIQYRVNVTALSSGTINIQLNVKASLQDGICQVTAFTSSLVVIVTVLKDFGQANVATKRWYEGCWSPYRGYPTAVTFFEARCIYAGTAHQPQTLWLSGVDDFEDFDACTKDDSSFSLTLDSDTRNAIRWLSSLEAILIGTTGGEWRLRSGTYDEPLTPTRYSLRQQTTHGSADIQPTVVNDAALFVDFVARKVRELTYDGDTDRFIAPDLTALAEDITETGITSIAFQKNPDPILWCTLTDGTLLSMTYEREQNVVAWAEHRTGTEGTYAIADFAYPTLVVADGTFATMQADPGLLHEIPISNVTDLQAMKNDLTGHYYLTTNIDASDTANWNSGAGFVPIGTPQAPFTGTLDGCGYRISDLFINRNNSYQGLFGQINEVSGTAYDAVANLTLTDIDISCSGVSCGSFVGVMSNGTITNCSVSGTITAIGSNVSQMGGFVGYASDPTIYFYDCVSSVTVDAADNHTDAGTKNVGGFVGEVDSGVTFTNCRATGNVAATGFNNDNSETTGGFAGYCEGSAPTGRPTFIDCAATGDVTGDDIVGGFAGDLSVNATVTRCSARGNVTANATTGGAGGFAGYLNGTGGNNTAITDCYAWGDVTAQANGYAGGYAQYVYGDTTITNCYSVGIVSGPSGTSLGGFIQYADATTAGTPTIATSYWDTENSGEADGIGFDPDSLTAAPIGHVTTWMKTKSNYEDAGWDFTQVWTMPGPTTYYLGFESVAVIPTSTEDEIWVTVVRMINSQVRRYVERFAPRAFGDQEDAWFVDSGLSYDGGDTYADDFSGLEHLESETVAILGDGAVYPSQTVVDGIANTSNIVSKAVIGLPYTYNLKPMRFDLTTEQGTTKGSIKRISEIVISFFKSGNVWYGTDADNLLSIDFRTTEAHDAPPALFTGDKPVAFEGGFDPEDSVLITGSDPLPCTVRAIVPRLEVTGR